MNDLNGKVAVVTGASRGLGRRVAARLALEGATVALLARSEAGLEDTRREDAADINGQFLWINDGLQSPIPSWGEPSEPQPWRTNRK